MIAVGRPGLIKGDCIDPGAVVIDAGIGIHRLDDGRLVRGLEFAPAAARASWIGTGRSGTDDGGDADREHT